MTDINIGDQLPDDNFVSISLATNDWWSIDETGDTTDDDARGREFAADFAAAFTASGDSSMIWSVVQAVVKKGRFGPLEDGFFQELGEQLLRHRTLHS